MKKNIIKKKKLNLFRLLIFKPCSLEDRASDFESENRGFESRHGFFH